MKARYRVLLSIPLMWFVYKGHAWANVAMFALCMIAVEMCALICLRLIERNKQLLAAVQRLEKATKDSSRVNAVLSDVFDKK